MSYPPGRDTGASRPDGGEPGAGRHGRDTRAPAGDRRASRRDPRDEGEPGPGWRDRREPDPWRDAEAARGRPAGAGLTQPIADGRRRGRRRPLSLIWRSALRGGLAVCVIVASAAIGAAATIVTRAQPGLALGLFVLAGTVAAALTVEPRAGRLIFPVPALSYLIAALASGVAYNRSANKTELAVGAAQWIADGFFVMVLATLLAIALTTVRWFLWRRHGQVPFTADWQDGRNETRAPGGQPGQGPRPGSPGTWGRDQPPGPGWAQGRPQGPGRGPHQWPGSGPYNFSSGA
jgi:hypothetical protein